uniref:Uncharacterized mitochondrial protein AtMg00810-like n=1 Tax=Nicotiana tabacum TaxID=4097 RepID=A0A1S4CY14_TOBAC|nr:PREDICTED: uncharacterized mitochondrial protein AtMg00810-like [Nicotiana tabacum]
MSRMAKRKPCLPGRSTILRRVGAMDYKLGHDHSGDLAKDACNTSSGVSFLREKTFGLPEGIAKVRKQIRGYSEASKLGGFPIYVDDIVLTGNRSSFIDSFVQALGHAFSIRDLGPLHYFLGIQVCHNSDGICLSQSQYIQSILTKAGMIHCKLLSSPMATNAKLNKGDIPDFDDPSLYRQAVGALQYLTLTSPDISFMVNKVCQFMHNPSLNQWVAVKRILRYLQHTKSMSFLISKAFNLYLQAFTDSDWAGSIDDRCNDPADSEHLEDESRVKSIAGRDLTYSRKSRRFEVTGARGEFAGTGNAGLGKMRRCELEVASASSQQATNSDTSTESEYKALADAAAELMRTQSLMIELEFVRDKVARRDLLVQFLSSKDHVADILTKPLETTFAILAATKELVNAGS